MQKDKKSFDVTTARKLIGDYAEKLNLYMKENQNLKNQIEDLKMTLKINKDLLFKYISTNVQQTEQINFLNDYKNDNMKLSDKNEKLHMDKNNLEKKVIKIILILILLFTSFYLFIFYLDLQVSTRIRRQQREAA
jgi:ABC-type multidrug transport system permease subunit